MSSTDDEVRLRTWFEAGLSKYAELIQQARDEEFQAGTATERERCANIAEDVAADSNVAQSVVAEEIAARIRSGE